MNDSKTLPKRRNHPGSGRRAAPVFTKGRQIDPGAQEEVQALLGDRELRRDLLIEFLHLIQDRYGCLSARHLQALADEMRLPMAEVYEVASFYAHFDIVLDGRAGPGARAHHPGLRQPDLRDDGGSGQMLARPPGTKLGPEVRVVRAPCMGRCDCAPVAEVGPPAHRPHHGTTDSRRRRPKSGDTHPVIPAYDEL